MIPTIGDIYCTYVEPLQQYAACQVTGLKETDDKKSQTLASIVELDWSGDQPLSESELAGLKPLLRNFYFWNDALDHRFVEADVPANYKWIANIPPLVTEPCRSYDQNWDIGNSLYQQRKWNQIDLTRRQQFKQAQHDTADIQIGHTVVKKNTSTLRNFKPASAADIAALAQLHCLIHLEMSHFIQDIIPFMEQNPFLRELHIEQLDVPMLDLSGTHLTKLILHTPNLTTLKLNKDIEFVSLADENHAPLHMEAEQQGRGLTLSLNARVPELTGISQLQGLQIHHIQELDLQPVIMAYPELQELRLWGKPGTVSNLKSIQYLQKLQFFTTFDLFGFSGEDFPDPEQLPKLRSLWLNSLPADAAKAIKVRYKKWAAYAHDLDITKPRKPEWLAENLTNPFRDWDGRDSIPPADAKKATSLYKRYLKDIREWSRNSQSQNRLAEHLITMVETYTTTFNQMDARSAFIDTIEREEIHAALSQLLTELEQQLALHATAEPKLNREGLYEIFEREREF